MARRLLVAAALALAAGLALASEQAVLQPATPETRRPIIVDSLTPPAPAPAAHAPPVVAPAPAAAAAVPTTVDKVTEALRRHEEELGHLQKSLEEGLQQRRRLLVAQKLLEAIVHLKKAERILSELDTRVDGAKAAIKKFGEQADEIAESIKGSEAAHRKELADLNTKLGDLRNSLGEQEKTLATLVAKRGRIAETVSKWKSHVAALHDVHETLARPPGTPAKAPAAAEDAFPEPPALDVNSLLSGGDSLWSGPPLSVANGGTGSPAAVDIAPAPAAVAAAPAPAAAARFAGDEELEMEEAAAERFAVSREEEPDLAEEAHVRQRARSRTLRGPRSL